MTNLDVELQYAWRMVGIPYKWGGRNPLDGLDCSQLVQEVLTAGGRWPVGVDKTAQGIYDELRRQGKPACSPPEAGALAFFGQSATALSHVGYVINRDLMIEAGGGDQHVVDRATATARGAMVRVRPIRARKDFFVCLMP